MKQAQPPHVPTEREWTLLLFWIVGGTAVFTILALIWSILYPTPDDPNACRNPAMVLNPCRDKLPDSFFPPGYSGPRLKEK
jgi:hypothetical protein